MAKRVKKSTQGRKTKRGSATRYGPRYGAKHKKRIQKAELTKRKQICPVCGRKSLNKKNYLWVCTKCGAVMAGGAYAPKTLLGKIVDKVLEKKRTQEEIEKILEEIEKEPKVEKKAVKKKETKKVVKKKTTKKVVKKKTTKKVVKKKTATKKVVKKKE
jgi:large subunit ribosomal protein L37Ae